jgi:predicted DNA repair protein MutK
VAGTSLLALIDDIASILDDVALMTKVAAKKTAGVLGDDLALNAEQVSGVNADRELPVVWAVAKGSFRNKLILVPLALIISAAAPWAITPILMMGGAYLSYEGFEKVVHKLLHKKAGTASHPDEAAVGLGSAPAASPAAVEKTKIRGAVRTDFILSAEIIVIGLGTVAAAPFGERILVLSAIAVVMTVGVYGLVAGIVKIDDAGVLLAQRPGTLGPSLGRALLWGAPYLMKGLSLAGTVAMFLVGGGILSHGLPGVHAMTHKLAEQSRELSGLGFILPSVLPTTMDLLLGIAVGALVLAAVAAVKRLRARPRAAA